MITVQLRPKEEDRIRAGHLWVFKDEISKIPNVAPGTLVRVIDRHETSYGTGFCNPLSKITVRLLGTERENIDAAFFTERVLAAQRLREQLLPGETSYRLLFGESDLMSGLIIDRYGDYFVIQMLAAGMDQHRDDIVHAIRTVFPFAKGVIEKNMAQTRLKEGLELREGLVWGTVPETVDITENGLTLRIDLVGGQKTGYFLDQKINRAMVARFCHGKSVLDCFCNVGGFALNAAAAGAREAVGVDSSAVAVAAAQRNAEINGLSNARFEDANVFELLRAHVNEGRTWDVIILDPPSFAKSRTVLRKAHAGYAELNRLAMKALAPGGILVSASCTQLVPEAALLDIIYEEGSRLQKRLRLLYRGTQAPDHPVLLAMPETQYLKLFIFDIVNE